MIRLKTTAMLLGATALTLPLALTPAAAQQQQQEQGSEGACEQLYQLVKQSDQAGEDLLEEFQRAPQVAERNEANACVLMVEKVDKAGGISKQAQDRGQGAQAKSDPNSDSGTKTDTESFRATDTVSQTVEIEKQAIVEGQVLVRQPIPEVEIDQGKAEVQVRERPSQISVDQQQAQIVVRQKQATIRVAMPRPTITVEQPAPEIIITMPAPGVNIDQEQPEVNVVMAKPTVSVAQADPQVDVDVQARLVGADEAASMGNAKPKVRTERTNASGQQVDQGEAADVVVRQAKPSVRFMAAEADSDVQFNRASPKVTYEAAEPNVEVTYADEPRIDVRQVGDPVVKLRRKGSDQAMADQQQGQQQANAQGQQQANAQGQRQGEGAFREDVAAIEGQDGQKVAGQEVQQNQSDRQANRMTREDTTRLLGIDDGGDVAPGDMVQVTAADLEGRDVHTLRGEEVGEIEGIFENDGQLYAIISHGGFLGMGEDEIAIPAERIAMQGDEIVLLGLTDEQLDQMPDYDFDTDQEMAGNDVVEIGRRQ